METASLNYRKIVLTISLLLITIFGYSQTTLTYSTSGTFIVPAGVTTIQAEAWGAGGAGGGNTTTSDGAGGGGGGAYSKSPNISVTSGSSYDVSVGVGGTGGTGNGQNGSDSYFSNILTLLAKGGFGGNSPLLGAGGTGGNGGSSITGVGTTKYSGGNGGNGRNSNTGQGGPGATSAGTGSNGLSGAISWSTTNAPTPIPIGSGGGAQAGSSGNNGFANSSIHGGGGGGGGDRTSSNTNGGNGADGQVILNWVCPTYTLTNAASNNGPICVSSPVIITLRSSSLPSGTYKIVYNLSGSTSQVGNTATMTFIAGSPGTGTFSISALNNGTTTVTITNLSSGSGCNTVISSFNTTSVIVNPNLTASVGINASISTICAGTNITFTAIPTNGGTAPVYQWKLNGTNVGTNSTTYSNNSLANGNTVTCVMTSNATACLAGSPATSNTVTMTVSPNVTATVSISATATTTCAGISETFTAIPTNGGTTPTYQWKKNGLNVGANSTTYASSTLATGDAITCVMTSNATCVNTSPATSNTLMMTVNPTPTITGTTPDSRIGTGTVVLGATGSANIFWFTTLTGGGPIGGGTTFTTPSITTTSTFYASAVNINNCASTPRTAVVATVYNPEIDILGNAVSIADGDTTPSVADWTDFDATNATRTYTIKNTGTAILNIGAITLSGTNASDFMITSSPSSTIAIGSSTSFTIAFNPTAAGTRRATILIENDDNNENHYDFSIQGNGIAQEINVQGNGVTINDGDNSPTTADWTDFSNVTFTRTYTILNSGNLPLTIGSIAFSGPHASEFTVTTVPVSPVPAYGSTTFTVTFSPLGVGVRVATLNIVNDDSDENPYDYSIIATGVNIDSDGDGRFNGTDADDDNDGITDVIECGTCLTDPFINGGFETSTPLVPSNNYSLLPVASVPGWQSSPENIIELWNTEFLGVPAAEGNQFAELNANVPGTLYQVFCLNGASGTITWSIKHRGRDGIDQAFVRFGATLIEAQTNTPIATMVDGNTNWGLYSGTYIIPAGQTQIVLAFQAGYTASGSASIGNFIDDVQITINQACIDSDGDGLADIIDLDSDNDGIPDIEEAGFKAYSNNTTTFDKTNAANWKDVNANGINDYIDTRISAGTYFIPDTDGDGIPNYLDLDSDNDSLFDVDEAGILNGDGDINGDGKGDGGDTDRDGILNLYDNSAAFGTTTRAYALDTDGNGVADFLQLDSNSDGINDIKTGLYGDLDANNDGEIDGTADIDRDGIIDAFDTNTAVLGSPRNLNRKLFLDFDGRNDYGQDSVALSALSSASIMAWIDLNNGFSSTGVVVAGPSTFQLRINSNKNIEAVVNGTTLTYTEVTLNTSQWYHVGAVYNGATLKLYLNGVMVNYGTASGSIASSVLTLGKNPIASNNYFKGKIDEVRVFNVALTDSQLQRMVYQEIQNTSGQVRGTIVPKDIESLPYANLLRYFRMDAYKDDIIDDHTTAIIDAGIGMKIYNHKIIKAQEAPMPFVTRTSGTFATGVNDSTKDIRGLDATDYNYAIVQVKHDITATANSTSLAMFVEPGVTITMSNNTKIQNDWYLKLDGKIDLQGKSQLIQTANSELDVTSAGSIERDQQGQSNKYNYNYWSSPVGAINTTSNNNSFTLSEILRDGTNPNDIKNITWTSSYDGVASAPITLSSYWIFKFQNLTPDYSNWSAVGQNGTLQSAQGFTMKGSGAATASQNYTFVGKPNNGTITTLIAPNNLNLSGNPYPSALDADAFIAANSSVIAGTLYFWEHYNTNTSHNLLDYQGGYAARNLVGGTPPVSPTGISGTGGSNRIPSRFIPVGQGFLVYGNTIGGNITFNNNQRSFVKENEITSSSMFRQNESLSIIDKQFDNREDQVTDDNHFSKIRLGFNSANNYHRQILLGFMNEFATDGYDVGYDAVQLDTQPNDLYFSIPGGNLVIQGVGAFNSSRILPLSLKNGLAGNVQFTIDTTENFDANQNIYIHDNDTNQYHDIRNGNFDISLPIGTFNNRFSLCFLSSALDVDDFDLSQEVIVTYTNNDNTININNDLLSTTIDSVTLYNILGQSIKSWNVKDSKQTKIQIPVSNFSTGAYIVKVHTTNGDLSKKIIIK